MMGKAFWQGFRVGFLKYSWVGIALALGVRLGNYFHPYESCKRMYETPEDISECVLIKENP